jgi:hypothetical protein
MREVTLKFVQEPNNNFHVEVNWGDPIGTDLEDAMVEAFRPILSTILRALPGHRGEGEGSSKEEARMKAMIERDINSASEGDPRPAPEMPDLSRFGLENPMKSGGGSTGSQLTYKDLVMFIHCEFCMKELPPDTSPAEYVTFEVAIASNRKLAVYCKRHKRIIAEFTLRNPPDFECSKCGADHGACDHGKEA